MEYPKRSILYATAICSLLLAFSLCCSLKCAASFLATLGTMGFAIIRQPSIFNASSWRGLLVKVPAWATASLALVASIFFAFKDGIFTLGLCLGVSFVSLMINHTLQVETNEGKYLALGCSFRNSSGTNVKEMSLEALEKLWPPLGRGELRLGAFIASGSCICLFVTSISGSESFMLFPPTLFMIGTLATATSFLCAMACRRNSFSLPLSATQTFQTGTLWRHFMKKSMCMVVIVVAATVFMGLSYRTDSALGAGGISSEPRYESVTRNRHGQAFMNKTATDLNSNTETSADPKRDEYQNPGSPSSWIVVFCVTVGCIFSVLVTTVAQFAEVQGNGDEVGNERKLSTSLNWVVKPILFLVVALLVAFTTCGVYGVALLATGFISTMQYDIFCLMWNRQEAPSSVEKNSIELRLRKLSEVVKRYVLLLSYTLMFLTLLEGQKTWNSLSRGHSDDRISGNDMLTFADLSGNDETLWDDMKTLQAMVMGVMSTAALVTCMLRTNFRAEGNATVRPVNKLKVVLSGLATVITAWALFGREGLVGMSIGIIILSAYMSLLAMSASDILSLLESLNGNPLVENTKTTQVLHAVIDHLTIAQSLARNSDCFTALSHLLWVLGVAMHIDFNYGQARRFAFDLCSAVMLVVAWILLADGLEHSDVEYEERHNEHDVGRSSVSSSNEFRNAFYDMENSNLGVGLDEIQVDRSRWDDSSDDERANEAQPVTDFYYSYGTVVNTSTKVVESMGFGLDDEPAEVEYIEVQLSGIENGR